uniref:Uncharacterized protein n=1 Tax=Bionectria ochroleuca TaxID=29856 RepID=A0A0B7K352_BIOOC
MQSGLLVAEDKTDLKDKYRASSGEYFCVPCYCVSQRRSRQDRRENPRGTLHRSEDWVCGNAVSPYATEKYNGDRGYIDGRRKDATTRRCFSCFRYWKDKGHDHTKFNPIAIRQD